MRPAASICEGEVVHKRVRPTEHKLRYRVFSLMLDVDQIEAIAGNLSLLSLERFNIFSLRRSDHGYRDERSIAEFAWDQVKYSGFAGRVQRIDMLVYPRLFGFAFNPLTVYFCRNSSGGVELMIYEVRNTFGENLTYVVPAGTVKSGTYTHAIEKQFYVSPFNDVDGDYRFHVREVSDETTVGVALQAGGEPLLRTHFRGRHRPLTDGVLLGALFRYPLMTLKVVAGIHWEAARLWLKGLTMKERPQKPTARIVYAPQITASGG